MRGHQVLLRQCVLAAAVLGDLDLAPADEGVVLLGAPMVPVTWAQVDVALAGADPLTEPGRRRVGRWLRLRRMAADHGPLAGPLFARAARLMALPPGHLLHPGPGWARERLHGGALELGVGLLGIRTPELTESLPPGVAEAAGIDVGQWWPNLREHAERMGSLAAARLRRDNDPQPVLRPIGGCDVLALLSSGTLRAHLAGDDGTGMRALAVPTRSRGWYDLRRIDPAFIAAAWSATDPEERGFDRAILVTADEVAVAPLARTDAGRAPS